MKKIGIGIAVAVAAALILVLLAHAPVARGAALRYALAAVQRNYGLTLRAERLDYNLATLRIGLAGLRVAAEGSPDEPFFEGDYVSVALPAGILLGNVAFKDISVTNGRVLVHRRADGTSNLPESEDSPGNDPPPLRIDRVSVPRLEIDVRDEQADLAFHVPGIGFELTPEQGSIALAQPASLRFGSRTTQISRLNGQAAFDGRALRLIATDVRTDDASMTVNGTLLLIARESRVDLAVTGSADLARLARWGLDEGELPQGEVIFRATAAGPIGNPDATIDVESEQVSWRGVEVTDLSARALVNSEKADVETLEFGFSSGTVTGAAAIPFETGDSARLNATWTGIDTALAARMAAPDAELLPASVTAGRFDLEGVLPDMSTWVGTMRLELAPGRNAPGRVSVGGNLVLSLRNGRWMLEGRPRLGGVAATSLTASGALDAKTIDGNLRLGETDIPSLLEALRTAGVSDTPADAITSGTVEGAVVFSGAMADPSARGRARISALSGPQLEAGMVNGVFEGRPLSQRLDFTIEAPSAVIADQALNDLRAMGTMNGTSIVLTDLSANQPGAPGMITGRATYDTGSGTYTVTLGGTDWQLMATAEQPLAGRLNLRFEGSGTTAAPRGSGTLTLADAAWQEMVLGTVDASVELDGRTARIEARAPHFDATATGRVTIDAPYNAAVTVNAGQLDLARVLQGIETPTPVSGTAGLVLRFDGSLETWRTGSATLDVTALDAMAGSLDLRLAAPAKVRYERERVFVDSLEVDAGETRLSATGDLDAFEPARAGAGVLVTLTGEVAEVARAVAATGLTDVPVQGGTGPVALLARVNGSLESPVVAADLELGPGSITLRDLPQVSALVLRAHAENGWLELREGAASYQDATITVTGRAPLSWVVSSSEGAPGNAEIQARATNLTAAILAPFVDPTTAEQLEGSVDATLDAASPTPDLTALTGELRLDRLDVRIADLPVGQRVPTRIVARDGFARIEAWDWVGQGTTLNVRGQVRLEDRQAAILANGLVDLRMLTPFVRDAGMTTAGRLEPRLSITGPIDDPRVDGDLTLTAGELRLADPRVVASGLTMRSVVNRTSARITSLTGTVNGGMLTGTGGIDYSPEQGLDVQLSTTIGGMALEFPEGLRSEVDADLDLVLKVLPEPSGRLSGTITVVRGSYREPLAVVAGLLAGQRAQRLAVGTVDSSPLLEALALDIALLTEEDIIVNNNYGRFQLGGDLQLVGTAAAPSVTGRAELREGGQLFVGRNVYTITSGTIDFANPVTIDPVLNIQATTRAGGEEIEVALSGPAENPTPTLSSPSNPELTESDRVSLLLTGRRFDELDPGDAAFVGAQVLGNLSGEVLGFAGRAIGLDTIRLGGPETTTLREDPIAVASQVDPTMRLTFGKSIGPDLEVTFSQSLRDGDAQTWIVEYLVRRGLELRLVSDDQDLRSYGFRHDVAFGGPPRPDRVATASRPAPPRVASVSISGDLALPEERVHSVLRMGPGDRFDFVEWQNDRDRLEALYFANDYLTARITPERSEGTTGVDLEYQITAGPSTRIVAEGIDLNAGLRMRLETAWVQSAFDDFLRDEAIQIVRETLAADGYLQAVVKAAIVEDGTTKTLSITVERGGQTSQTMVRVEGEDNALADAIVARLEEQRLINQAASNPAAVERAAADYLRTQGYLRARVTAGAPLFEGPAAIVPLTVDAGPQFAIATMAFEGAVHLSADARLEAVALTVGAPYDAVAIDSARDRLVARYRGEAFPAATVTVRPDVPIDGTGVSVTFVVDEGPQQVLGEAIVAGNRTVDAGVIVRMLGLERGEPVTPQELLQARTRILDMGLFRRVDVTSETAGEGGGGTVGQTLPIRLRITVEEWPALRLRYGLQVAEQRPETSTTGRDLTPGLSADVTRRTLFGKAITLGAAVEWQRKERGARTFLNTGTLFGWPIGSSLIAERSRVDSTAVTLVTDRSSITWEQRVRVARNVTLSYAYSFERNHTFDTTPPPPDDPIGALDITINIARLTAAAAWDTRDDPVDTTRGTLLSGSLEDAPASIGSDIRFVRELAQAYHFRPWRQVVFASAGRIGVVSPLGGQDLLTTERFFVGGARTVRGVDEDSLGPRDFFFDEPQGGRLLVVLNQEARVPIYRWIRGVAFVDAGNVFTRPRDASLRDLVGSLGFGLRLATPFALFRVDFAKPVWGEPAGSSGRWIFGIGQAF
jgi:outer membrane protein assembly factor BamA/autotransporter translocation and assembly factor TamB